MQSSILFKSYFRYILVVFLVKLLGKMLLMMFTLPHKPYFQNKHLNFDIFLVFLRDTCYSCIFHTMKLLKLYICILVVVILKLVVTVADGSYGNVCTEECSKSWSELPCETINYYAFNSSLLTENFTLFFLQGIHTLNLDFIISNSSLLNLSSAS